MISSSAESYGLSWWWSWLPTLALLAYASWRYADAVKNRPSFKKEEVVYQEFFASGASRKNILTQIGGASNCLRLVVTRDFLWVTSWFPFSLLTPVYDLEHVIALRAIVSVERVRFLGFESLVLKFTDQLGGKHSLRLFPQDRNRFLRALSIQS